MRCNYLIHDNGALIYGAASAVPYVRSARREPELPIVPALFIAVAPSKGRCPLRGFAAIPLSPTGRKTKYPRQTVLPFLAERSFSFHRRRYLLCIQILKSRSSGPNRNRARRNWNSFSTGSRNYKTAFAIWREPSAASEVTALSPVGPLWSISGRRSKTYRRRISSPSWNGF